jgi:hypothetical protein
MSTLLLLHATATLAMTGVIWFVQLVHYPLFRFAAIGNFSDFAASHRSRTTLLVAPLMSVELLTALALAYQAEEGTRSLAILGLLLLIAIWLSTALIQVPLHRRLARGFDSGTARLLVQTNWSRTLGWSTRSVIALQLLAS